MREPDRTGQDQSPSSRGTPALTITSSTELNRGDTDDDHLIYAGLLAVLALTAAGDTLGLGKYWAGLPIVQRLPWLR
jgi:hypothetical protein